jgi:Ser/Thr protein kinase RdoA (MazF antagonist)
MRDSKRLLAAVAAYDEVVASEPWCLCHGDTHAGNLYETAEDTPGFYDWQTVHQSWWASDVSYYVTAALGHDDRRRSVEDLLRHYLDRLGAYGVTPPTWEEAWFAYRRALVYGFWMWAITRPIVQPVEVINTFVDRTGNALAEADGYATLGV